MDASARAGRAARYVSKNAETLDHLGLLRYQRGGPVQALSLLRRAVEANPRSATCHLHLGSVLEQSSDFEGALAAYREAARMLSR